MDGTTVLTADQVPLHRALAEGAVTGVEIVIAPPGLPARTVAVSGRAMTRADGTRLGAVVAQTDITADRAHRRELLAASAALAERGVELERSNTELERFAAVASHDLRSPLTVVEGYLELLGDVHGELLPEQAHQWIATARRGVHRMQALTGALLAYSVAGAPTCTRELTDVADVLDQAVVDLRSEIAAAAVTVVVPAPLPQVHADPVQLRQLLQNLVSNAIKYRSPDRPPRLEVSATRTAGARPDERTGAAPGGWEFRVADNGRGVRPDDRERVFAMFTSLTGTGSGTGSSTGSSHGIGLATCQRIVERHGGRIWLEDTRGGGTTACFSLPDQPDQPG